MVISSDDSFLKCSNFNNLSFLSFDSGADVLENKVFNDNLCLNENSKSILSLFKKGTPLLKFGSGEKSLMMVAGVHGNELPPQIAILKLIDDLKHYDLTYSVYIVPSLAPESTKNSKRHFRGDDLNRLTHRPGSLTNKLFKLIKNLKIHALGDFHSTSPMSNPGRECIFSAYNPSQKSAQMAEYIAKEMDSEAIIYKNAGSLYGGALEDECNLEGIPSITCETLSENSRVRPGSIERSYMQMKLFLKYFNQF